MRTSSVWARFAGLAPALLAGILVASAPGHAAERRLIVTPGADYAGFDLRTVKDVDLNGCQEVCLADNACQAFTFNEKAGWCFLKTDFGPLTTTQGATAGRVVMTAEVTPSIERQRLGELSFVDSSYVDEARTLAGDLQRRFDPNGASFATLRSDGGIAYRAGSYDRATNLFGRALALSPEDAASWLDFTVASNSRSPQNWSEQQDAWRDITAAAINAYLRAETVDDKAEALMLLGDGMGKRDNWKMAIRAYRASLALKEDPRLRSVYDQTVAQYGFRILSHTVDSDAAQPRICVAFSDDLPVSRPELADYIVVEGGSGLAIEPEIRQICIDGVTHGGRYKVRVRAGLPAADGETLAQTAELDLYVRDRAPWIGFSGNAYVLPAGEGASIPVVSVNTDKAKATIYRISDRGLAGQIREGTVLQQLSRYYADRIGDETGEKVWEGEIGIKSRLNENVTTAIPISEAVTALKPGAYVITASPSTGTEEWGMVATQWFVVSDLGLTSLSANDGVHVIVRSLTSAQPVEGAKVRLVASNDDVLGEATTNADGYARFEPGLARGTGGAAPQIVDAEMGSDYSFLNVGRAAFDLTDRGVDGRPAPGPMDVFMTTERGIYRPSETVFLTALVRDAKAMAIGDLPMTLVFERPDGVEFNRWTLSDGGAGGYSTGVKLDEDAMRGSWRARLYADPKGDALADIAFLVEDFEPERLAFEVTTAAKALGRKAATDVDISAKYLYGATAPGLRVEGDISVRPVAMMEAYPGYRFGLADDTASPMRQPLDLYAETDEEGKAVAGITLPSLMTTTKPLEGEIILRLTDTNGRAVERSLKRPIELAGPAIGIKPLFEGEDVPEGGPARFEAILVGQDGERAAATGLEWSVDRIETDYQWYRVDGNWRYEPVTTSTRVASGTIDAGTNAAATIEAPVDWGRYRVTVSSKGDKPAASSVDFNAGWYVATTSVETPDVLEVALDKPAYAVGETAKLRLDPRFPGVALIAVIDNRLISMKAVDVPEGGTVVELPVTQEWGPGAYVSAALYRPMDIAAKRMPSRALGIAWAKVAPGDRQLPVTLGIADEIRPRGPMTIPVAIGNLKPDSSAFVTVAAVDVGILNLTGFQAPKPDDWYFGQRRLGTEIRDLYGMLIDRTQGEPGTVRSGGDGGSAGLKAPPPTQKLVALFSGIVEVGPDGNAEVSFDLPEFNGSVRVMAMAWTDDAVGHAEKDVIVRDPVVVAASVPRFMATGDSSRLLVEINNVAGAAGDYRLSLEAGEGITLAPEEMERTIPLMAGQRTSVTVPITGAAPGDHEIRITLAPPSGDAFPMDLVLGVRPPGADLTRRNIVAVNGGGRLTVGADTLAEFVPGTTSVTVSLGGAGRLDVAGILAALDRYPYGCAEQLTSRALPLVYLDDVAGSIGIASDQEVHKRVQEAIAGVLAKQTSSGSFGLWGPYDGNDLWLDAYVTDFLTRAAERGFDVPQQARDFALGNLQNRLSYAQDFTNGGEDIAYSLYVLARAGKAAIGDLRYYAESKLDNFATPLAKAQIGAALALYGDRRRTDMAFAAALADLDRTVDDPNKWRADYGTKLRDEAAVLTLAAETQTQSVDIRQLATRIAASAESKRGTSTQEQSWMMLAAAALIRDASKSEFSIDGQTVEGPLYRQFDGSRIASAPVTIENLGSETLDAVVATRGVPTVPEPAGGNGYTLTRDYYTPEGDLVDIATVGQNDRFVVVLTVTGDQPRGGRLLVVDPIPAGFEIENPNLSASGAVSSYDWLSVDNTAVHTEARTDRFVAALNRSEGDALEFSVAYTMRAVSPGAFAQPGATVEDMYRPELFARTAGGKVEVVGPTR
jgi:uncharacterized protein YfaS (alpha-2-macroglobulin family)